MVFILEGKSGLNLIASVRKLKWVNCKYIYEEKERPGSPLREKGDWPIFLLGESTVPGLNDPYLY